MCSSAPCSDATTSPATPFAREPLVIARGVGKCYEIYQRPIDRLKQTLYRGRRQFYQEFWALRNIDLEVAPGEAVGIIGRNGSGKSTLLQIIAGTLRPTEGQVSTRGNVHALLELGSGFNPEFTGRENVFLNGAILGISQAEMARRFEEIEAFADIGDFIDQPVKTYSTGMFMRLAFSVQVILDPDILIVDEALAVGDAGFQMKCYNRMRQLIDRGTAVVLVTHETQTVRTFCNRAVWLHDGLIRQQGDPREVTSEYVQFLSLGQNRARRISVPAPQTPGQSAPQSAQPVEAAPATERPMLSLAERSGLVRWGRGGLQVQAVRMQGGQREREFVFEHGDPLRIEFLVQAQQDIPSEEVGYGFSFRNLRGLDVITSTTYDEGRRFPPLRAGQRVHVVFELANILSPGEYALVLCVEDRAGGQHCYYDFIENAVEFKVLAQKRMYSVVLPPVTQTVTIR